MALQSNQQKNSPSSFPTVKNKAFTSLGLIRSLFHQKNHENPPIQLPPPPRHGLKRYPRHQVGSFCLVEVAAKEVRLELGRPGTGRVSWFLMRMAWQRETKAGPRLSLCMLRCANSSKDKGVELLGGLKTIL